MLQTGIVKEINRDSAVVMIERSSSCGESCASCGLCPGQKTEVKALNEAGAKINDTVIISMADKKVLGAAFLVYIVPLIALIAGYFVGDAIFHKEALAILTGFLLMALFFCAIIFADRRINSRYTPKIVRIVPTDADMPQIG